MARLHQRPEGRLMAFAALATSAAVTTAIAIVRLLEAAQRGVVCGDPASQLGHCWACYAAPLLVLVAFAAWRASAEPRPLRIRVGSE